MTLWEKMGLFGKIMNMSERGRKKLARSYNAVLHSDDDEELYICKKVSFGRNGNLKRYQPIKRIQ